MKIILTILILIGILGFIFAVRGVHAKSNLFVIGWILLAITYFALLVLKFLNKL